MSRRRPYLALYCLQGDHRRCDPWPRYSGQRRTCQCECHERTERLLRRSNVFHFSSYWQMWSRVLTPYRDAGPVVVLNLTPVNAMWPQSWEEQIRPIVFRRHGTAFRYGGDEITDVLPIEPRAQIIEHVGEELLTKLIETDWLPLIDLDAFNARDYYGGGLPFERCAKGRA